MKQEIKRPIFTNEYEGKTYILQLSNKSASAQHSYKLSVTAWKILLYCIWNAQYLSKKLYTNPLTKKVDEQSAVRMLSEGGIISSEDIARRQLERDDMELYAKDMYKTFNISRTNGYSIIKNASKELINLQLIIQNDNNNDFCYINIFTTIKYDNGVFRFTINKEFIPHIINLEKKYILSDLNVVNKFKKTYSVVFYHYFKSKVNIGRVITFNLDIKTIYTLLNIEKNSSYCKNFGLFKSKILTPVIKEINENSKLKIKFLDVIMGQKNKVISVKLRIYNGESIKSLYKLNNKNKESFDITQTNYKKNNEEISKNEFYIKNIHKIMCYCGETENIEGELNPIDDLFCKNCGDYSVSFKKQCGADPYINDLVKGKIEIAMKK